MSSDPDVMIRVRGLGKRYAFGQSKDKETTLAEAVVRRVRAPFRETPQETFWALNDINFDVRRSDVVGVIGRNGAGKSTLFKVLSRITEPTTGRVDLYGRVGSLLEVGTGFSGELTGRENIYLNGTILGMRRAEITKRFDEIVDFAGVEKFLDTPVKRYSSGMYVRLAFAVAAHLATEILILDEVLAVGDAAFQLKCLSKVRGVARDGRTVLIVSHNMSSLRSICDKALLLTGGRLTAFGTITSIADNYEAEKQQATQSTWTNPVTNSNLDAELRSIELLDGAGYPASRILSSEPLVVKFHLKINNVHPLLKAGFDLIKGDTVIFQSSHTDFPSGNFIIEPNSASVSCSIPGNFLFAGRYEVRPFLSIHTQKWLFKTDNPVLAIDVQFDPSDSVFKNLLTMDNYSGLLFPSLLWSSRSVEQS